MLRTVVTDATGTRRRRLHALVYLDADRALAAVAQLRHESFVVQDVHTPFPVHGMAEAMGLAETRLPYATLLGAAAGTSLAFGFQVWSHAHDWPLKIGGKDLVAWPALIPVTFELAVLLAAFATVGVLVARARLWPRSSAATQPHREVTDDKFVVVVEERDGSFAPARFRTLVEQTGAESWIEGWRPS